MTDMCSKQMKASAAEPVCSSAVDKLGPIHGPGSKHDCVQQQQSCTTNSKNTAKQPPCFQSHTQLHTTIDGYPYNQCLAMHNSVY